MVKKQLQKSRAALVTGGSSGIGAALVNELVRRDVFVYSVARSEDRLAAQQRTLGPKVVPVVADVSTSSGRERIADTVTGPLDFLVHNAGVIDPVVPLERLTLDGFRQNLAVNAEAVLFLTQALLPRLVQPGARVLAVSSGAGFHAIPGWAAYCTAKAAMNMMVQVLNAEWQHARGISAALVRPGVVDTPMQAAIRACDVQDFPQVEKFRQLKRQQALADPVEVAEFMVDILLCTDDKNFSTVQWDFYEKQELAHKMSHCAKKNG